MNEKPIVIPASLRRRINEEAHALPRRYTAQDEADFLAALPPELQADAEEAWARWAEQNEELVWAIVETSRERARDTQRRGRNRANGPAPVSGSGDPMLDPKLSVAEASRFLGIGVTQLRCIVADGEIPFVRMGSKHLFFERDLAEYIKARYVRGQRPDRFASEKKSLPSHIVNSPLLRKDNKVA